MSIYDQVTVVVGIDAKTIEQLRVSWPTWKKHRPEMWSMRWVMFWDSASLTREQYDAIHMAMRVPNMVSVPWNPQVEYESQREKMLTGHVFVPAEHVKTDFSMKIDADVVAERRDCEWLQEHWFDETCSADREKGLECDADCEVRYVAPSWFYTKGQDFIGRLERWGDVVDWGSGFTGPSTRLNLPNYDPTALRFGHKRMCSWVSYYNVNWLQWLCGELEKTVGRYKLPVPSQDTTVWYAAAREQGDLPPNHRLVNMKKLGWDNISKINHLKARAAQICAK